MDNFNKTKEMLGQCLAKSINGTVGLFVYGSKIDIVNEQVLNTVNVGERVLENVKPIFHFTKDYVFLTLEFGFDNDANLLASKHLFETYLEKSTKAMTSVDMQYTEIYTFVCDVATIEEKTYRITVSNPMFQYREENRLNMVFPIESLDFNITEVDYSEIEKEVDYEARVRDLEERKRDE